MEDFDLNKMYKKMILTGKYDEKYKRSASITEDRSIAGVSIDFSRCLADELNNNGYIARIISIKREEGIFRSAVLYKKQSSRKENAIPKAISEKGMNLITTFMSEEEKEYVVKNYTKINKGDIDFINDYPLLEKENIYKLNDIDRKTIEKMNGIFLVSSKTCRTIANILTNLSKEKNNRKRPKRKANLTDVDEKNIELSKMYELLSKISMISEEEMNEAKQKALKINNLKLKTTGKNFKKMYSRELGLDVDEVYIADPIADIKRFTQKKMQLNERKKAIQQDGTVVIDGKESRNVARKLEDYIKEFGKITIYNPKLEVVKKDINSKEELETISDIIDAERNEQTGKVFKNLLEVNEFAKGATKESCEILYEKGMDFSYSNMDIDNMRCVIYGHYNSLSNENKEKLQNLVKEKPDNYVISEDKGTHEIKPINKNIITKKDNANIPMKFVIMQKIKLNSTVKEISDEMKKLVQIFERQVCMNGVYTKDEILNNKHKHLNPDINSKSILSDEVKTKSNVMLANEEGLVYSFPDGLFFESYQSLGRYRDSKEKQESIKDNQKSNSSKKNKNKMVKPKQKRNKDAENLENRKPEVTATDISFASILNRIPSKAIAKVKQIFEETKER